MLDEKLFHVRISRLGEIEYKQISPLGIGAGRGIGVGFKDRRWTYRYLPRPAPFHPCVCLSGVVVVGVCKCVVQSRRV